ncbi:MAG: transcription antitermination factor NusB [Clostridia bacterium]|nr:transcription antitermination factor NusB [Clostridia bacterium]
MSRTTARELALKIVFEFSFQDEDAKSLYEKFIDSQEELNSVDQEDEKFILELIEGIKSNLSSIDEKIKAHLKDWNIERVSKVDLAILRLAIYEILYREDIPFKVSVNEAVELSKQYGEDSSPSFINGVLAEIIKEKE